VEGESPSQKPPWAAFMGRRWMGEAERADMTENLLVLLELLLWTLRVGMLAAEARVKSDKRAWIFILLVSTVAVVVDVVAVVRSSCIVIVETESNGVGGLYT
jgi:hypothetical protein